MTVQQLTLTMGHDVNNEQLTKQMDKLISLVQLISSSEK